MTYHARPPASSFAPPSAVRRFRWSDHSLARLKERAGSPLAQVQRDAQLALTSGRAEEWWEWDDRRLRGWRRNLLVRVHHPSKDLSRDSWVLFRLDERDPTLAHVCTVLTPHHYQANATLLWSKTRGGPRGATPLTHRLEVRQPGRK